ncbi:unnamed protein product, partial [Sphagnum jensenii]
YVTKILALLQAMWFKGSKGTTYANKKLKCLVTFGKIWTTYQLIIHCPSPPPPL